MYLISRGFVYLSISIQLSPHFLQLQFGSALYLLQLCNKLLLQIQPQPLTMFSREL